MAEKKWFLRGKLKDNSPWFIPVDKSEIIIGRSRDCSLILQAPSISRRHSQLRIFGDAVYLKDMGSRNGTYINGVKLNDEKELRDGDIIRMGMLEFVFQEEEDDDTEKTIIDTGRQQEKNFAQRFGISAREEEVLYLLIKGLKIKDISDKLFISQGTAKNHVLSIYQKTGCHSRIELSQKYQEFS